MSIADQDTNIENLTIAGEQIDGNVAERIVKADVELTISGASTFTLEMNDDNRKILRSGLFSKRNHTAIDGVSFEMVALEKQDDLLTATFEDTVVAALRKQHEPIKVDAETMTHVDFARRLVEEVPGVRFITAPSSQLSHEALHRGSVTGTFAQEKNPEDTWEAIGRMAGERQWRRFVRNGEVWYVTDDYLFALPVQFTWKELDSGVDFINFRYDTGEPVGTLSITVRAKRWTVWPGDLIEVTDVGPASGTYLASAFKRSLFSINGTVEGTIRLPELDEPKGEDISLYDTFEDGLTTDGSGLDSSNSSAPPSLGGWRWPTNGTRISGKYHELRGIRFHEGIDIAVAKGSPVWAANDGLISFVGQQSGFGNVVNITHADGLVSVYGHVFIFECYQGQVVKGGEEIAVSGGHPGDPGAGDSQGDHLHFQINLNGQPVDPNNYVHPIFSDSGVRSNG